MSRERKKKSAAREWFDALLFAVIAASLIRWLLLEPFTIPTASMEKSLLVGDFLFVSKMNYGTPTPKTIIQMPLTLRKFGGRISPPIQMPSSCPTSGYPDSRVSKEMMWLSLTIRSNLNIR